MCRNPSLWRYGLIPILLNSIISILVLLLVNFIPVVGAVVLTTAAAGAVLLHHRLAPAADEDLPRHGPLPPLDGPL